MAETGFFSTMGRALAPRQKAVPLSSVSDRGWYRIFESFTGAWQQNVTVDRQSVLANHAVFACMTLIASDISKLRVKLVEQDSDGIWSEVLGTSRYAKVLRKPNGTQNRIQFWENWMLSKLSRGNTYVLKERDGGGMVSALRVLDPNRVKPMLADDGAVYYQLSADNVAGVDGDVLVPASEIIHDRFNCLFHPLVGLSPIFANGVAATQGLAIQNSSTQFFNNRSQPGGLLVAPGAISIENATRLKDHWEANYTGSNAGRIAVLGDGLEYKPMMVNAHDSQLIEQLQWSAEVVCSTFHVPPYKIGVGEMPAYNNVQSLNVEYYAQCLQVLIEAAELCLDEGLGIGIGSQVDDGTIKKTFGTEFDVDNLLRMDTATQMDVLEKSKGVMKVDEMRKRLDLKPTAGGNAVYLQQQNFSIEALAKRDASEDPFKTAAPKAEPAPVDDAANDNSAAARQARSLMRRAAMAARVGLPYIPTGVS